MNDHRCNAYIILDVHDGVMSADGEDVYVASDMKVGLFTE